MDGGPRAMPALQDNHLEESGRQMDKGVGLACIHYAVEPTKERGEPEFLQWMGGAFEVNWSVNPTWVWYGMVPRPPDYTRGVKPFQIRDEWYFHMRFAPDMQGVTPILSAVAPASTMSRPNGPHEGNPSVRDAVARGEPQVMAWAFERHLAAGAASASPARTTHKNWADDNYRKTVLNALLWIAKVEVPPNGVESTVSDEDLKANLDLKPARK